MKIKVTTTKEERRFIGVIVSGVTGFVITIFLWWLAGNDVLPERGGYGVLYVMLLLSSGVFTAALFPALVGGFKDYINGDGIL